MAASASLAPFVLAEAGEVYPVAPLLILLLCAVAGVGTVLLLPGRMRPSWRRAGGVLIGAAAVGLAALAGRLTMGRFEATEAYFWAFAAIALAAAVRVVTHPRPVYSALYFVLTVFATAGLFILLQAEFMAAALVLIYAGAILITYVFVIMLAASTASERAADVAAAYDATSREPIVAAVIGYSLMGMLLFVIFDKSQDQAGLINIGAAQQQTDGSLVPAGNVQALGLYLFRNQLVNLELAGLILTLAMVGAIVIARRQVIVAGGTDAQRVAARSGSAMAPATPVADNPHDIPVYGTDDPAQKAYPQT